MGIRLHRHDFRAIGWASGVEVGFRVVVFGILRTLYGANALLVLTAQYLSPCYRCIRKIHLLLKEDRRCRGARVRYSASLLLSSSLIGDTNEPSADQLHLQCWCPANKSMCSPTDLIITPDPQISFLHNHRSIRYSWLLSNGSSIERLDRLPHR